MTNPTFTVTARGQEIDFTSAFATLALAFHALDAHPDRSEFACDLLVKARARQLSPKQAAWIHKLATDLTKPASDRFKVDGLNLAKIIEIFDTAHANEKKFPRIVLAEAFDDDRVEIPDEDDVQKARDILRELYRRAAERNRPKPEQEYIERLLRRF